MVSDKRKKDMEAAKLNLNNATSKYTAFMNDPDAVMTRQRVYNKTERDYGKERGRLSKIAMDAYAAYNKNKSNYKYNYSNNCCTRKNYSISYTCQCTN